MGLNLDARQRAMLQEMGIPLWTPPPARPAAPAPAPIPAAAQTQQAPAAARRVEPADRTDRADRAEAAAPPAAKSPAAALPPATRRPPQSAPPATHAPARPTAATAGGLLLRAPQAPYPQADAAATPPELGAGWLVVLENHMSDEPLSGDAGRLLDNMLRAMRLHLHPQTHVATLARPAPGLRVDGVEPAAGLRQALQTLRPSMVLVLGLGAARVVLDSREPLGRLRTNVHRLADGTPVVVSYDPAYLLRAPDAKAAAWADLCRALAVVRRGG